MVMKTIKPVEILLVENNPGDLQEFSLLFKESSIPNNFRFVGNGDEALEMLFQMNVFSDIPRPDVVIFDIHSFRKEDWNLLQEIAKEAGIKCIPVLFLTKDLGIKEEAEKHFSCPIHSLDKPNGINEYKNIVKSVEDFWLSKQK
jgi:two-component system response regulator